MYNFYPKKLVQPPGCAINILLVMNPLQRINAAAKRKIIMRINLTTLLLITAILQVGASTYGQKVTLSERNAPLMTIFEKISKQTGCDFIASTEDLKKAKPVTINVQNEELKSVLDKIFTAQPLNFVLQEKMVVISKKDVKPGDPESTVKAPAILTGKVTDTTGSPIPGASVKITGTNQLAITDSEGRFTINAQPGEKIEVSFIGFDSYFFKVSASPSFFNIVLHRASSKLNEVQVIGYGTTTKRLNTGSISAVSAETIEKQPVTNILSALAGQAAGVFVQTSNGLPGGKVSIQIRGQGSISAGNNPLYVIDGVPFSSTVGSLSALSVLSTGAINGLVSPFNSLNPSDIESVTILKDADATAIYGSRGSNGVVLITTKKGKAGKTKINFTFNDGYTKATHIPRLLNAGQYQQILTEALANDGIVPSSDPNSGSYIPELTTWKNLKNTDWAKYLLGGTGHMTNAGTTVSGGNGGTSFFVSANYHSEKTYLPGNNLYERGSIYGNIQHTSANGKFYLQFSNSLTLDNNKLVNPAADIAYDILLPPNYPVYDDTGNYNWYAGANPVAEINATANTRTYNIIENLTARYSFTKDFEFKISTGYNRINVDQTQLFPSSSLYPGTPNNTNFGKNSNNTFIVEPQFDYDHQFGNSTLHVLLGGTYQNNNADGESITASNFSSESLMKNLGSAGSYSISNNYTQYRYASVFGRVNYNIANKYIINATVRRDGSSRFGTDKQFGNFGSIGAAWLWSNEDLVKSGLPFISYGKLRASYGLTGNDQITDYQYLSAYGSSGNIYEGISGLKPSRIANPDFRWETTKKMEFALELGLLKNRVLLNINYYHDLTSDQLIAYSIPSITGFTSYQANLPAVVQNNGWEFELNTKNIQQGKFSWATTFNLTVPKNTLKSFPNLATSSYANTLVIGEDINRIYGYQFAGLDNTGLALYSSKTGPASNAPYSATDAYYTIGKRTPDFYGGIGNTLTYGNWSFDVFGQFAKQMSLGNLVYIPGAQQFNSYVTGLNRWTTANTNTRIPKASTINDYSFFQSSANYFNTSYFRVKNIAVAYALPKTWLGKMGIEQGRIFAQAQNMFTFWNRNNPLLDPESGTFSGTSNNLPPAKSLVIGMQLTF